MSIAQPQTGKQESPDHSVHAVAQKRNSTQLTIKMRSHLSPGQTEPVAIVVVYGRILSDHHARRPGLALCQTELVETVVVFGHTVSMPHVPQLVNHAMHVDVRIILQSIADQ